MNSANQPSCLICGASNLAPVFPDPLVAGRTLYVCDVCHTQMLLPLPSADELRAIYGSAYYKSWGMAQGETPEVANMKKRTFALRLKDLRRIVSPGPILDVGTASGFLLEVAREQGFEPFGVELSAYAADLAKAKFGEQRIWNGTLETAPFARNSFHAVTMCDLLEHVTDPLATLSLAAAFLRPGGAILVMTPNTGSLTNRLMRRRWTHYKAEHLFYFNREAIKQLAAKTGLELVRFRPAKKYLTLRYLHTQFQAYRHPILTPLTSVLHTLAFFARDWYIPLVIGEFVAVLRKPAS